MFVSFRAPRTMSIDAIGENAGPKSPTSPTGPATGIALIGSGIFAKSEHLPAIQAVPNLTLRAVYSRTLASAAALSGGMAQKMDWYSEETTNEGNGYEDLLKREDVTGLVIALPIVAQSTFVEKALLAGKHVLSEKPIAKDIATAKELLEHHYKTATSTGANWGVAENYRFMQSHQYAAAELKKLGRLLQFRVTVNSMVHPGGKYYETSWRKTPEYQGGFLLDGGVHFVAAMRLILGSEHEIVKVAAFTDQLQEHLPPVDTINATLLTKSGISGTFSVSFGTTFKGNTYAFACEKGTLAVTRSRVAIARTEGEEVVKEFPFEGNGVKEEVLSWSESVAVGHVASLQSPLEAFKDLAVLEAMLVSGDKDGVLVDVEQWEPPVSEKAPIKTDVPEPKSEPKPDSDTVSQPAAAATEAVSAPEGE